MEDPVHASDFIVRAMESYSSSFVVIKISLAALTEMHCWDREQLGHYFSGLSVDDKGTGEAGGSVRSS